jgi:murein DD-endopeptidase MepM/ murein hydrolase activator NlpD
MHKKISLLVLIILLSLPMVQTSVFAQDEADNTTTENQLDSVEASEKFNEVRETLNNTRSDLSKSIQDTSLIEQRLGDATELIDTLEGQLANIDSQLKDTERRIVLITINIESNEEKIEALMKEISILVRQIENQKDKLKDLLQLVYFQSEQVGFFDSEELQTIKLLLADENVSDLLERADSLSALEFSLGSLITSLAENQTNLENDKSEVENATEELKVLKEKLSGEQVFLTLQQNAKEKLLEVTQGEESLYTELLNRARAEQLMIRQDYIDLVKLYRDYQSVLNSGDFATDDFNGSSVLSWPISPSLGISAYFRDQSYKAALGLEHNAVDIRAPQATTIYAAADGVILKAKGGEGNDYHYVVIGHNSEVLTLYGHMYDIFVQVGQSVKRGEPIGLSGGMPGTRGAGWLTTGPHLHFEVFQGGKHVNPMDFLDTSLLPERYRK